jgi:hypothetical protein
VVTGTTKGNLVKTGVELETSNADLYARNALFEYECLPTRDSSLHGRNTCEYVTTTMQGLNRASKLALTCEKLMRQGHLEMNDSCGTHFHVSINDMRDENGEQKYMDYIRRFQNSLFTPLSDTMKNQRETTRIVFGRYFNSYAKEINMHSDLSRYNFINLNANSNIEFRLNKFVSAKQYQNLMKMEVEMVKAIINNFCKHFNDTDYDRTRYEKRTHYRKHKAQVTAKKLVEIYKKYANIIYNI